MTERKKTYFHRMSAEDLAPLAALYAIIKLIDRIERAYAREIIPAADYTRMCTKLLQQCKILQASANILDLDKFADKYKMNCGAALLRIRAGAAATVEHQVTTSNAQVVFELAQQFITIMDALKLSIVAVDALIPLLADVVDSLDKVSCRTAGTEKLRTWLVLLTKMKISDDISADQSRQLALDLE